MRYLATIIAARCSDAYSFKAYANWNAVALALLRKGYSEWQTEDIMRSKLTRWAGDASKHRYGRYTSRDVLRYLEYINHQVADQLNWPEREPA